LATPVRGNGIADGRSAQSVRRVKVRGGVPVFRKAFAATLAIGVCVVPCPTSAKGEGVGLWMEGTVSNLDVTDDRIHFVLTGRFWFEQYRGTRRSSVEVDGRRGLPVTLTQAQPFFAMSPDWRAGAIREEGSLSALVRAAARGNRVMRFELLDARLDFGSGGGFAVHSASVIRATDGDVR
jgi:hypothetical protein